MEKTDFNKEARTFFEQGLEAIRRREEAEKFLADAETQRAIMDFEALEKNYEQRKASYETELEPRRRELEAVKAAIVAAKAELESLQKAHAEKSREYLDKKAGIDRINGILNAV